MDGGVNLFLFGWTSPAGSTFNQYRVDQDGDVLIPKDGMTFGNYQVFMYHDTTGANPDETITNPISFVPRALSDARGFCGFDTHPLSAGEAMGGQVKFDFGLSVSFGPNPGPMQIVPGFQMRSHGTLVLDFILPMPDGSSVPIHYEANAAPSNIDPSLPRTTQYPFGVPSPDFYNHVSFVGGGIIPLGVWLTADSFDTPDPVVAGVVNSPSDLPPGAMEPYPGAHGYTRADGARWHQNMFGGFPFMLRADALRTVDFLDNAFYGNFDHDITKMMVTKTYKLGQGKPITVQLQVANNRSVPGAASLATVVGMQNGTPVYKESAIVRLASNTGRTVVDFGPFPVTQAGDITWTATLTDGDPDVDVAHATTTVK